MTETVPAIGIYIVAAAIVWAGLMLLIEQWRHKR